MTHAAFIQIPKGSAKTPFPVSARTLRAGCKINLYLRITGLCGEGPHQGWHELDTVFVPLDEPHDTLRLTPGVARGLQVRCQTPGIDPSHNTLTSAYAAYTACTGFAPDLCVDLHKGIPHGAGLGGGSSDAAALLLALDRQCAATFAGTAFSDTAFLPPPALAELASAVGADVPFFLQRGPCAATGIGEKLTPCNLESFAGLHLVLVCPDVQVSTPWAYKRFDASPPHTLTSFFKEGTTPLSCTSRFILWLENSFEEVVFQAHPRLRGFKELFLQQGALAAIMTGSGSALFGLFKEARQARAAKGAFQEQGVAVYSHVMKPYPRHLSSR